MITRDDALYAAGIIDGEGSISLNYSPSSDLPSIRVQLGMSRPEVIDWFYTHFGGYRGTTSNKNGTVWQWRLSGKKAASLLAAILPHTQIKKRHTELAIAIIETIGNKSKVSDIDMLKRLKCAEELQTLNDFRKRNQIPIREEVA